MKVFLSWSGARSKAIARELRGWLPHVIQSLEPWMSEMDIEAGQTWSSEIEAELSATGVGILCVTAENLLEPWIHFEAGALAKVIGTKHRERVCPLVIGLQPSDVPAGPLSQFQAKALSKEGMWGVLQMLNNALGRTDEGVALGEDRLESAFAAFWPKLESGVKETLDAEPEKPVKRESSEIIEEILTIVRQLQRGQESSKTLSVEEAHGVASGALMNYLAAMDKRPLIPEPGGVGIPAVGAFAHRTTLPSDRPVANLGMGELRVPEPDDKDVK